MGFLFFIKCKMLVSGVFTSMLVCVCIYRCICCLCVYSWYQALLYIVRHAGDFVGDACTNRQAKSTAALSSIHWNACIKNEA